MGKLKMPQHIAIMDFGLFFCIKRVTKPIKIIAFLVPIVYKSTQY